MSIDAHLPDMLPAYALDCLDEEETVQVSEHLAVCPACRAEFEAYRATVDHLALAAPLAAPPPALKDRLMARVRPEPAKLQPSWWQSLVALTQRTSPVWGAAVLLLVVALAVSNWWLWQRAARPDVSAPAGVMHAVTLTGTEAAPNATGLIVISSDGEYGSLVVEHLPALSPDRQYQLWLIEDGKRTSGAVFSVDREGYGAVQIQAPRPLSTYTAFGITVEPAGGSPGPTGDKVLGGAL